jgi:hypothetical protein
MTLRDDLMESINKIMREVIDQREEILRAFLAKYGANPDEVEQVLDMSDYAHGVIRWSIRKKGGDNVRSGV